MAHPYCSRLLYRIGYYENSPTVAPYLQDWKKEGKAALEAWVAAEQAQGNINPALSTPIAAHFLLSVGLGIGEWFRDHYAVDENLAQGKPMITGDLTDYYEAIDGLIALLQKSLQP